MCSSVSAMNHLGEFAAHYCIYECVTTYIGWCSLYKAKESSCHRATECFVRESAEQRLEIGCTGQTDVEKAMEWRARLLSNLLCISHGRYLYEMSGVGTQ